MKKYDAKELRKPFNHPVWGRALLFVITLVFPVLYPIFLLWENRSSFIEEWYEVASAAFLPWKNKGD